LKERNIHAASFTSIRIISGALGLCAILLARTGFSSLATRHSSLLQNGNWTSAFALFAYAAAFSFAYRSLSAGTGALILFGAVQATMVAWDWRSGDGLPRAMQLVGLALALAGLVGLVLPGLSAPPLVGSLLMAVAGIAWGVYSL